MANKYEGEEIFADEVNSQSKEAIIAGYREKRADLLKGFLNNNHNLAVRREKLAENENTI